MNWAIYTINKTINLEMMILQMKNTEFYFVAQISFKSDMIVLGLFGPVRTMHFRH